MDEPLFMVTVPEFEENVALEPLVKMPVTV